MKFPKLRLKAKIKNSSKADRLLGLTNRFFELLNGRKANLAVTFVFTGMLAFFLILNVTTGDKGFSPMENRTLASMPKFTVESVTDGSYMKDFEAYASDNIILRDVWVKVAGTVQKLCGKKDNGSVYYGSNGYLFAVDTVDVAQIERNNAYVKEFMCNVQKKNPDVRFSVIVVPTASEIQKQFLPANAPVPDQEVAIDGIADEFGDVFFDVLPALSEHSQEYIYYRTDHHWTTLGAWYAYRQWANQYGLGEKGLEDYVVETVSTDFYGTNYSKAGIITYPDMMERYYLSKKLEVTMATGENTEDLDRLRNMHDDVYNPTFLKVRDKYSYFLDGNNALTYITIAGDGGKTAKTGRNMLVIKDSYAHCFIPFLQQDFDEILAVDLRYYKEDVNRLIQDYHITDIMILYNIIQYSNERNLVYLTQ